MLELPPLQHASTVTGFLEPPAVVNPGETVEMGPRLIGADLVASRSRGDGVRVGIVDTGIDDGHLNLHQSLMECTDVTGTGWTPDAHGSQVAGIIASDPASGTGMRGVAPDLRAILQQTAKRFGPAAPDPEFGYGLSDVCQAMAKVSNGGPACR